MKLFLAFRFGRFSITKYGRNGTSIHQLRGFQPGFSTSGPRIKPQKFKYPDVYNPYGARPPPSDKVVQLADRIVALPREELEQIGPALQLKLDLPRLQHISGDSVGMGPQSDSVGQKAQEEVVEKTTFDVKLERFEAASKVKVIKEVRAFTGLGLKEAKETVEKAPVLLKQGVTKEEADSVIEKIKAAGGVAVVE